VLEVDWAWPNIFHLVFKKDLYWRTQGQLVHAKTNLLSECRLQASLVNKLFCPTVKRQFAITTIYTTTGLGPRKNREMAGVDDLVVYMQTAVKYRSLYILHLGVVCKLLYFPAVCINTTKSSTPAIFLFF